MKLPRTRKAAIAATEKHWQDNLLLPEVRREALAMAYDLGRVAGLREASAKFWDGKVDGIIARLEAVLRRKLDVK